MWVLWDFMFKMFTSRESSYLPCSKVPLSCQTYRQNILDFVQHVSQSSNVHKLQNIDFLWASLTILPDLVDDTLLVKSVFKYKTVINHFTEPPSSDVGGMWVVNQLQSKQLSSPVLSGFYYFVWKFNWKTLGNVLPPFPPRNCKHSCSFKTKYQGWS